MKKLALIVGLIGTIAVGSIAFTGGDIIDRVNEKVSSMFDMISTYESNEIKLVDKINQLKSKRDSLKEEVESLKNTITSKDSQIVGLESQIEELNRQIEILSGGLDNKNGLLKEIIRLENEVKSANNKVSELQAILDKNITDEPLTESEMEEIIFDGEGIDGTIYFASESVDENTIQLSSYAQLHIKKYYPEDGGLEFLCTVSSTTDDGFNVEVGNNNGSQGDLCYNGNPFVFKMFSGSEFNYSYITIDNGEYTYRLVAE